MKLAEYKLRGWRYNDILKQISIGNKTIVLLKVNIEELGYKGDLKNLLAIDKDENILWITPIPKGYSSGYIFNHLKYEDGKLKAWKDELYCEIDMDSGKILFEQVTR